MNEIKAKQRSQSAHWIIGTAMALGIVPLAGVLYFVTSETPDPTRPRATLQERHLDDSESLSERQEQLISTRSPKVSASPRLKQEVESPPPQHGDGSPAAQADAEQLARFDDNAARFERLISTWEEERQGGRDEERTVQLQALVSKELTALEPTVSPQVECTTSACVVEVTSDVSVGTLIARLSPWLRRHPHRATGDPADLNDTKAFRIAFESNETPRKPAD